MTILLQEREQPWKPNIKEVEFRQEESSQKVPRGGLDVGESVVILGNDIVQYINHVYPQQSILRIYVIISLS
jgi:hypothetical protein